METITVWWDNKGSLDAMVVNADVARKLDLKDGQYIYEAIFWKVFGKIINYNISILTGEQPSETS